MRKYLFLLVFLCGCAVATETDTEEEIVLDESSDVPDGWSSESGGQVDPCAPIYEIVEFNGVEHILEIPVECHPLDLPIFWWGPDDYHDEVVDPMEEIATPEPQGY